jgi:hypothetical protein
MEHTAHLLEICMRNESARTSNTYREESGCVDRNDRLVWSGIIRDQHANAVEERLP